LGRVEVEPFKVDVITTTPDTINSAALRYKRKISVTNA
jgi:hypothetical protein